MSCGEQPLVLTLLPVERLEAAAVEPGVDRGSEVGLAAKPGRKREVADLDREALPQVAQRPELVQLAEPVRAVAGLRPGGNDEPGRLQVAKHPGRPARSCCCSSDCDSVHGLNLTTVMSMVE